MTATVHAEQSQVTGRSLAAFQAYTLIVEQSMAVSMDGNRVGVRATPHGFQAFCSKDGEEIHLGIFQDVGRAEHVADLGAIKAALEKGRPLQAR